MYDARRHEDLVARAALAREADLVVDLADVGGACEAARAQAARDDPLRDAPLPGRETGDSLADRFDSP